MSERYPGGFISKNAPTVSTSGAQGVWTLEQQAAYQKAGQWPFGGPFNYIEDVFSTYLYDGSATTLKTITNNIDTATYGGLVWIKARTYAGSHDLYDTARGVGKKLSSNETSAQGTLNDGGFTAFLTNGFTVSNNAYDTNVFGEKFVSWTFRKQPKFFDVVTYTGSGATQAINHNLGSTPGCIIIKNYNPGNTDWTVYHRSLGTGAYLQLNNSNASVGSSAVSAVSSTTFTVAGGSANWNSSGQSYVAYIFAHDAGGFGTSGTDNVISCGAFTSDGSGNATVNLGYEPQYILWKGSDIATPWYETDIMSGWSMTGYQYLSLNSSAAQVPVSVPYYIPTATGFTFQNNGLNASKTYIYIAIRRGPMKTPTSGTSVLTVYTAASTAANQVIGTIPVDLSIVKQRTETNPDFVWDRLRGSTPYLITSSTNAEANANYAGFDQSNGYREKSGFSANPIYWLMARAPGFMDVVCYTGTGADQAVSHNLGVTPEFVIVKNRTDAYSNWQCYHSGLASGYQIILNSSDPRYLLTSYSPPRPSITPGTTTVTLGGNYDTGNSGSRYVAYLFASCPGVSKVGSYSGTGGTQTISCGFAARFVLIKRTDSTGNWWVWDTARGMVAGTDPRLAFNVTDAESNANWVYTDASGFQIVTTDATVNASGGSYIYLAIA